MPCSSPETETRGEEDEEEGFLYPTDEVVLVAGQWDCKAPKPVAHVPQSNFDMYFPGAGTETTLEVNGVKGMRQLSIRTFRVYADEALVKFLAHWLVFGDAEAALNATFTNDMPWIDYFCRVIQWVIHDTGITDLHDALIDGLFVCLKRRANKRGDRRRLVDQVYYAFASSSCKEGQESCKTFSSQCQMLNVLTVLHLHHLQQRIVHYSDEQSTHQELDENIRHRALAYLVHAYTAQDLRKMPQDILQDSFDQHCLFHLHGDKSQCYKLRWRDEPIQKQFKAEKTKS